MRLFHKFDSIAFFVNILLISDLEFLCIVPDFLPNVE